MTLPATESRQHNPGFRVIKTRRTSEEVTQLVREMIFDGALRAADRLPPEHELATMLGVGRPALREALRALEFSGLIELRKGKSGGAFISNGQQNRVSSSMSDMLRLRNVSVAELFEAREWILSSLVRPACRRITAQEIQGLHENVRLAEWLHKQGRYQERIATNLEFHKLLSQATRNPLAASVLEGMTAALQALICKLGTDLGPKFFSRRHQLIQALDERDEETAARRMAEIVKGTQQTYMKLAQEPSKPMTPDASASSTASSPARHAAS